MFKIFVLNIFLLTLNCSQQTTNSNSNDKPVEISTEADSSSNASSSSSGSTSSSSSSSSGSTSSSGTTTANPYTTKAIQIIANNCYGCHGSWSAYRSDADWINSGLVTQGDAQNSVLIINLINSGGSMPANGKEISNSDYQTLQKWIDAMK